MSALKADPIILSATGTLKVDAVVVPAASLSLAGSSPVVGVLGATEAPDTAECSGLVSINTPFCAEWLIKFIVPQRRSEFLLGCLEERFHHNVETRGFRRARALYWAETLQSILPILITKAKKLGLIALIAEIWRRMIH